MNKPRKETMFRKTPSNSVVGIWTKEGVEIWIATALELEYTYQNTDRSTFAEMLSTKKLVTSQEGRLFLSGLPK